MTTRANTSNTSNASTDDLFTNELGAKLLAGGALAVGGIVLRQPLAIVFAIAIVAPGAAAGFRLELITAALAATALLYAPPVAQAALVLAVTVPLLAAFVARRTGVGRWPRWLRPVASAGQRMTGPFGRARDRRTWRRVCARTGLDPAPRLREATSTPTGARYRITTSPSVPADEIARRSEHIATAFHAREVRVERDRANAASVTVTVAYHDPLMEPTGPWVCPDRLSLWNPLPIGLDEDGRTVELSLFEQHALIGGVTRAGKSNLATMIVAAGALDPDTQLWLIDPKGGMEFGRWRESADRLATDPAEATKMLKELVAVMVERQTSLTTRKLTPQDGPLHLLVIDELAQLTHGHSGKTEFNNQLTKLTAMGASVGVIVVACTQKPEVKIVPGHIRENMPVKIALRTLTPQASDTILGDGHAAAGYSGTDISPNQKGTAWLAGLGDHPFRFRAFQVTDSDLDELVARAASLRPPAPEAPVETPVETAVETPGSATVGPTAGPAVVSSPPSPVKSPPAIPVGDAAPFPGESVIPHPVQESVADEEEKEGGEDGGAVPVAVPAVLEPVPGEKLTAKQAMVEAAVLADPSASNREIARRCGVDKNTVTAARRRLGVAR